MKLMNFVINLSNDVISILRFGCNHEFYPLFLDETYNIHYQDGNDCLHQVWYHWHVPSSSLSSRCASILTSALLYFNFWTTHLSPSLGLLSTSFLYQNWLSECRGCKKPHIFNDMFVSRRFFCGIGSRRKVWNSFHYLNSAFISPHDGSFVGSGIKGKSETPHQQCERHHILTLRENL